MQSPIAARLGTQALRSGSDVSSFVCRGCLARQLRHQQRQQRQRRAFSSASAPASVLPPPPRAGFAALASRQLLSVSGPDAAKFLQGMISASVPGPSEVGRAAPPGFYAAFLTAQGRVAHDVFVYLDTLGAGNGSNNNNNSGAGDSFLIEADASEAASLQALIRRYKLRAKFDVRVLSPDEWRVWHVWDDDAAPGGDGRWKATIPDGLERVRASGAIVMPDTRAPGLGWRVISGGGGGGGGSRAKEKEEEMEGRLGAEDGGARSSEAAYTVRRYLAGVPEGPRELARGQALPHEGNLDLMGGIDFRKGCYVGQELTIRTQHRGVVRKRVLPCALYVDGRPAPRELAYRPDDDASFAAAETLPGEASIGRANKTGRSAGKWLRGVGNVGLALCRLEIMTDVALPGEQPSAAYNPEDEFIVKLGGDAGEGQGSEQAVKIKAFVPAWLREGLSRKTH